jgi:hypothetical protein
MSRHAGAPAEGGPAFTLTVSRTWVTVVLAVLVSVVALVLAVIPVATATTPVVPASCSAGR